MSLKHVDRVDGRSSEVPQPKRGVEGGGDEKLLSGMSTDVGQLLVVTCIMNKSVSNAGSGCGSGWSHHTCHVVLNMNLHNCTDMFCPL